MAKKVSSSQTKAEILEAYEELLAEIKQERAQNAALQREAEQRGKKMAQLQEQVQSGGASNVPVLRQTLNEQLDALERGINQEQEKFVELQQAITIEKQTLEELYKIKAEAESLDALVITHRQTKEKLERERQAQQEELDVEIEKQRREWEREQEAYAYDLQIKRRDEMDAYQQKKNQQEKELAEQKATFERTIAEREAAVTEQEEELASLRQQVAGFETQLRAKIEETRQSTEEQLTKDFNYQRQLETKDLEAELKLREQEIASLKNKVKEQQEYIDSLTNRTENATQQVKDIALRAIENTGARNFMPPFPERMKEEKGKD